MNKFFRVTPSNCPIFKESPCSGCDSDVVCEIYISNIIENND